MGAAYAQRGQAYLDKGDYERGLADCGEAVGLRPEHGETRSARAIAYIGKGDFARAIADLKHGLEYQPESPEDWSLLCLSEKAAGREDDCRTSCDAMFRRFDPTEDPEEANLLAWTWAVGPGHEPGRARAIALAAQATATPPDSPDCGLTQGAVWYRAGELEEAAAVLAPLAGQAAGKPAAGTLPRRALAAYLLTLAQHRLARHAEAQTLLREAEQHADELLRTQPPERSPGARLAMEILRKEAAEFFSSSPSGEAAVRNSERRNPPAINPGTTVYPPLDPS